VTEPRGRGFAVGASVAAAIIVVGMLLRFATAIGAGDQAQLQILTLTTVLATGLLVWLVVWLIWYVRRQKVRRRIAASYPNAVLVFDLFPSLSTISGTSPRSGHDLVERSTMSRMSVVLDETRLVVVRLNATSMSESTYPLDAIKSCNVGSVKSGARTLRTVQLEIAGKPKVGPSSAVLVLRTLNGAGLVPARAAEVNKTVSVLNHIIDAAIV
jgi:hypothetical protein